MTEQPKLPSTVSEMIRTTADNQLTFLTQIADHIDKLESHVKTLEQRIVDMEQRSDDLK